ncbi:MAG: sigma 54-interacting transcriptional regulator [Candidatus Manganitrophus sp. SB1]|nr:sigma 54-interacting transcriptional regulator [Candidatus Manganitrophus morganii]
MKFDAAAILNAMSEGVFAVNTDKKVIFANRALGRMLFHHDEAAADLQAVQQILSDSIFVPKHAALLDRLMFNRERVSHYETVLRDLNGMPIPVQIHIDLLLDEAGEVVGAVEIVRNLAPFSPEPGEKQSRPSGLRSLVGKSKKLLEMLDLVASASGSTATVLLEGESGTGKELIARAIHQMGPRREKPFIAVNCASLPDELLESELFGHMKGAFTTAIYDRPGRFELADHGTLFLDEIGDMSPTAQAKVLRVLQEHEFERVGGTKTIQVDVRIIAATNKDLTEEVRAGKFREDLYYRIRVFPIRVPPLRERKDDIFPLIKHFMAKFSRETGKQISNISPEALEYLLSYDYPGNVRELENMIEHAFVTSPGPTLSIEHLPKPVAPLSKQAKQAPLSSRKEGTLADQEKTLMLKALEKTDWNQAKAAEELGISRSTLWRRLKEYGIKIPK